MDSSSISLFMYDLRALEDTFQPHLKGKTDAEITQKMVMGLIDSNEQLKTQLESLRGRAQQVAYLPVVSKLEQVVCDALGVKNSKMSDGTSLEQFFVEGKAASAVKQLTALDTYGRTPFVLAVQSENFDMAKWLLEVSKGKKDGDGGDLLLKQLTAVDNFGMTTLARVVESGNLDMLEWFLEVSKDKKDADGVDLFAEHFTAEDVYGRTPFAIAVESGNFDMAKCLLEQLKGKKDVDGTDLVAKHFTAVGGYGRILFIRVLWARGPDMVKSLKWLLEVSKDKKDANGTDLIAKQLTAVEGFGRTAFTWFVENKDLDMIKWLLEVSKDKKDANGTDLVAKQLTDVDRHGKIPFEVAVESGNFDMAKCLLEASKDKKDADGSDLVLKQLTAVCRLTNLKNLIEISELFPVLLAAFRNSVDKLPDTLSDPFKKALGLKERPSASEFYCALALLEEPSKLISNQIKAWNVLRDGALKLPNKKLCIRATCALKKLMADPSRLSSKLAEVLNDLSKPIAWRLMYLEIALDDNQANAQLFTSMLDECKVNFRDDSIQKCLLILSLMESVSIAQQKGGDRDKLVRVLHFLFDMNETKAFLKEVRNFRSTLMILSDAELNSHLDALDQTILEIKETSEASKEITKIKDQIASIQAAPTNHADKRKIKELEGDLKRRYQKFSKDSCRKCFRKIVRAKADVECDVDKMLENLEKALAGRYPDAHITYLSTLSSARNISEAVAKKSVSDFFKAMEQAHGPSPCWEKRYSPEHNPHIREVENVHPGFYQKWQGLLNDTSLQKRFDQISAEIINADDAGQKKSTREVLENALRDGHLSGRDDFLQRLLRGDSEESLLDELEVDLKNATVEQRDILLAQKELILLTKEPLEGSANQLGGRFERIGKWLRLKEGDLFKADLDTLKALVMPKIAQKASSGEISLRGDFASILLGGTEIRGSCQHIEYPSEYSRGTVGYLLNGHLMLGYCDSERWTMRTLLRPVLLEQKNGVREVVLLLERIYPVTGSEKDSLALITAAQEIASRLGVGLVSVEAGGGDVVEGDLLLAGGVAPEYVDSGDGGIYEAVGEFKLRESHWLYKSTHLPAEHMKS